VFALKLFPFLLEKRADVPKTLSSSTNERNEAFYASVSVSRSFKTDIKRWSTSGLMEEMKASQHL